MNYTYKSHLTSSKDLETTYESVRAGFVAQALEKNKRATPMVLEAKALKSKISKLKSPIELLKMEEIYHSLLTASGLSDKAIGHLKDEDKVNAINNLIEKFLEPAGEYFVDELIFRYLLVKGDSLGGQMRNVVGYLAEVKFMRALVATLNINDVEFYWLDSEKYIWAKKKEEDRNIESHTKGFYWKNGENNRTLLFNSTLKIVTKNIDLILINGDYRINGKGKKKSIEGNKYIALGELKGGIDPAGADEHWKTAFSALARIKTSFREENLNPKTFFIGAAIAISMASEIWNQLENNLLDTACNLNGEEQLFSVCNWLINL
jgi:type II restriction enzyme